MVTWRRPRPYPTAHERCPEKIAHADWVSAEAHCQEVIDRDIREGRYMGSGPLLAYRCPRCALWHVGHARLYHPAYQKRWAIGGKPRRKRWKGHRST